MTANVPAGRWGHLIALALAAFCLGAQRGPAQTRGASPAQTLRRAEELYRADRLLQAEALFRQALRGADGDERRRCFDRLLAIYARVGRQDQAIRTGLDYELWLRRIPDL